MIDWPLGVHLEATPNIYLGFVFLQSLPQFCMTFFFFIDKGNLLEICSFSVNGFFSLMSQLDSQNVKNITYYENNNNVLLEQCKCTADTINSKVEHFPFFIEHFILHK